MPEALFAKILILSSLPNNENQTGKDLYDWLIAYRSSQGLSIQLEYVEIDNSVTLVSRLQYETNNVESTGIIPIIHIEAHGTNAEDGIVLKDNSIVAWQDLHPYLAELNIATKLNTILVLGLCSGAHFAEHIVPSDRSPCWVLIGPKATITDLHLKDRFKEFYREIFRSSNGNEAIRLLNESSDYGDENSFFAPTAEHFFKATYRKYLSELCNDDACRQRALSIREGLKQIMFPVPHEKEIALLLMTSKDAFFEKHKNHFFMVDIVEEHSERFQVTYEDVST